MSTLAETLRFDAGEHRYWLGSRELPSVTHVLRFLQNFEHVPQHVLEAAAQFGSHVHDACHLHNLGRLDWDSLDVSLVPYLKAYDRFLVDTGFVVQASEERVSCAIPGYAGTLDLRGRQPTARGKVHPTIIDIKTTTTLPATVGPQLAAYEHCVAGRYHRRALLLRADGTYKCPEFADSADWSIFVSALNIHRFKEKHHV